MPTTEQLAWLRQVLELANAITGMRDIDDPGAVVAAALVVAAATDDPGVLEGDGDDVHELLTVMRASVRETSEPAEDSPGQALLVVLLALAGQGKLDDPEQFVSRVAELLDRWGV